jgi:hypothetical protein
MFRSAEQDGPQNLKYWNMLKLSHFVDFDETVPEHHLYLQSFRCPCFGWGVSGKKSAHKSNLYCLTFTQDRPLLDFTVNEKIFCVQQFITSDEINMFVFEIAVLVRYSPAFNYKCNTLVFTLVNRWGQCHGILYKHV